MVCDKEEAEEEEEMEEEEEEEPGYRIKNKNPTQRCGEQKTRRKNKSEQRSNLCCVHAGYTQDLVR